MDWQAKDTEKIFSAVVWVWKLYKRTEDPRKSWCCSWNLKAVSWQKYLCSKRSVFGFIITNWLDEAYLHHGEQLLYSRSTNLNIHLIQKTLIETSKILLEHIFMHCDLVKMTCKKVIIIQFDSVFQLLNKYAKNIIKSG